MRHGLYSILAIILLTLSCKDLGLIVDPPLNLDPRTYKLKVDVLQSPDGGFVDIRAIWGTAYNNKYAVGSHGIPYTYMFFHFDGNGWMDITEGIKKSIFDYGGGGEFALDGIYGFAANDFWVVGSWKFFHTDAEGIKAEGFALRHDGTKFVNMTPQGMPAASDIQSRLLSVWGTSSNNLWVAEVNGFIFHWNGAQWTNHRMTDTTATISRILGRVGNRLYTFSSVSRPPLGFALHEFDGASWREIWYTDFSSGWFVNPVIINDTIYAAGSYGQVVRFNPDATGLDRYEEIGLWGVEERSWEFSRYGFRGLLGSSLNDFVIFGGQDAGSQYNGVAGHYNGSDVMPYHSSFIDGIVYQRGFRFEDSFLLVGQYEKGGSNNVNIIVSAIPQ